MRVSVLILRLKTVKLWTDPSIYTYGTMNLQSPPMHPFASRKGQIPSALQRFFQS
jgi:hypothetical protein